MSPSKPAEYQLPTEKGRCHSHFHLKAGAGVAWVRGLITIHHNEHEHAESLLVMPGECWQFTYLPSLHRYWAERIEDPKDHDPYGRGPEVPRKPDPEPKVLIQREGQGW